MYSRGGVTFCTGNSVQKKKSTIVIKTIIIKLIIMKKDKPRTAKSKNKNA